MNVVNIRSTYLSLSKINKPLLTIALLFTLGSCNILKKMYICPEGKSEKAEKLIDNVVYKLTIESQSKIYQDRMIYKNIEEFYKKNKDCCYIQSPENFSGGKINFPVQKEVKIAIFYKKFSNDPKPYSVRYVSMGPCPSNVEEAESRLNLDIGEKTKNINNGWKIK